MGPPALLETNLQWLASHEQRAAEIEARLARLELFVNPAAAGGGDVLKYPAAAPPPLALLGAAQMGGVQLKLQPDPALPKDAVPMLVAASGDQLQGVAVILRYITRLGAGARLYPLDALLAGQVDQWLELCPRFSVGAEFEGLCTFADNYLETRTFLVGERETAADVAVWGALVASGPRWESLRKSAQKMPHLTRWFNALVADQPKLAEVGTQHAVGKGGRPVGPGGGGAAGAGAKGGPKSDGAASAAGAKGGAGNNAAAASKKASAAGAAEEGSFEIDLPDARMGAVCTRFPPEPSGFLHMGHAKAALLNQYFAQKYAGKLLIRFDDTNPSKEKDKFVENIMTDLGTLEIKGETVTYTSDYFPQMMELCERMLKEGKAYVDDTPLEQMRAERMDGINSKRRDTPVAENLVLWKEMIAGSERGRQCCVRGKLDMQAPNKTLRDPVYYRCNPTPHHRVGTKYQVYPTYDFACPFVDAHEGVTHALRSSEYHDRNEQYQRIGDDMGVRRVHLWDFSRLNFVYTLLSKRKLQWFVDTGRVEGWDDPRFPTIQGVMRRGLKVEALRQFILSQGASKNQNLMEWDKLWTTNKRIIDPVCPRHTAVLSRDRVLLTLTNGPEEPFVRVLPRHKKFEGAGLKATQFARQIWLDQADAAAVKENEEVTLMDWGNAIVRKKTLGEGGRVTALEGELHLEGSVKTTKLKLTWLADSKELVPLMLVDFDYLITKKKLEEEDDFTTVLNPVTRWDVPAVGDANMRNLAKGDILQLERKGYYIVDVPLVRGTKPIILFAIPDGRNRPPPGEYLPHGVAPP